MTSEWLVSMGPAVANHLWQSTAFVAVVWAVALLLRGNHARTRYWVWMAASLKFLAPFALLVSLGGMLPRPRQAVVTMPVYSAVDEVSLPFADAMPMAPTAQTLEAKHRAPILPLLLAAAWVCGMVATLAVWCVRWGQVAGTLRRALQANEGREAQLLQRVQRAMAERARGRVACGGVARGGVARIGLVLSHELMEPGVFGVFRPVLIWPARLSERLDDEHIEAILIHEIAHVRRRDNLMAALHMLVEAAFWFHPLVWWVGTRLVEERERACDEAVVELGSRPGVYAESLLKAVRFCVESPLPCVAGVTGADLKRRVHSIMTLRLRRLGVAGKMALAALALAAIAAPVAFGVVRMVPMYGQISEVAGPLPSFEAVTIKPSNPERSGKGFSPNGRHFSTLNTTASDLLQFAYGIQARQIVDAPAWLDENKFDIAAVAGGSDSEDPKWNLMVRKLLADRFGLTFHHDTRELPVYELRVGRNGPKLTKSEGPPDDHYLYFSRASKSSAGTTLHAKVASMEGLAMALQTGLLERPVVDRTGLTGTFDFNLDFAADTAGGGEVASDVNAPAGIFTAIQEQLGLKLVAGRGPADVIAIDRIQKPVLDSADALAKPSVVAAVLTEGQRLLGSLVPAAQVQAPSSAMVSQGQADAKPFKFDVVSIRPAEPEQSAGTAGRKRRVPMLFTDDGLSIRDLTLHLPLATAYELNLLQGRILNAPDWVDTQHWSIEAKVADSDVPAFKQIAHDNTPEAIHRRALMLQAMFAERFKLRAHMETREGTFYTLVVAKGGVKAKQTSTDATGAGPDAAGLYHLNGAAKFVVGPGHLDLPDTQIRGLEIFFTQQLGAPVIDKTGLTGRYDLKLDWQPNAGAGASPDASDPAKPSLSTAMEEQLGLKLVEGKGPLPVLVIDHIEKPSVDGAEVGGAGAGEQGAEGGAEQGAGVAQVSSCGWPEPLERKPENLNFAEGALGAAPEGWLLGRNGTYEAINVPSEQCDGSQQCATIHSLRDRPASLSFLYQNLDVTQHRGQTLIYRAFVRVDPTRKSVARLLVRLHRKDCSTTFRDDMGDHPITSGVWELYEIRAPIAEDAYHMEFGVQLVGQGATWIDRISMEYAAVP